MNDKNSFSDTLLSEAERWNMNLPPEKAALFSEHFEMVLRWNGICHLTAITDKAGAARRHYLETLLIDNLVEDFRLRWLDVGTGGGFPGVPLKILHPELEMYLLESLKKKSAFLKEVSYKIGGLDLTVINDRAETFVCEDGLENYEAISFKAVGGTDRLLKLSAERVLTEDGFAVIYAGEALMESLGNLKDFRIVDRVSVPWAKAGWVVKVERR